METIWSVRYKSSFVGSGAGLEQGTQSKPELACLEANSLASQIFHHFWSSLVTTECLDLKCISYLILF